MALLVGAPDPQLCVARHIRVLGVVVTLSSWFRVPGRYPLSPPVVGKYQDLIRPPLWVQLDRPVAGLVYDLDP